MHTSRTFYLPMDAFRLLTRSDPDFSGYIVIDWEEWQPYMNPRSQSVYMQASLTYAGGNIAAAVAATPAAAAAALRSPAHLLEFLCAQVDVEAGNALELVKRAACVPQTAS